MRNAKIALLFALVACRAGESSLHVEVTAAPPLHDVDRLRILVLLEGRAAQPLEVPMLEGPIDLPPARAFQLRFDRDLEGEVTIVVDAVGLSGARLATGRANAKLKAGSEATASVMLGDGGGADADGPRDMADLVDLGPTPDMSAPPDLAPAPPDLAPPPPDLAMPPDLVPACLPIGTRLATGSSEECSRCCSMWQCNGYLEDGGLVHRCCEKVDIPDGGGQYLTACKNEPRGAKCMHPLQCQSGKCLSGLCT